jgi:hypothetical protein
MINFETKKVSFKDIQYKVLQTYTQVVAESNKCLENLTPLQIIFGTIIFIFLFGYLRRIYKAWKY